MRGTQSHEMCLDFQTRKITSNILKKKKKERNLTGTVMELLLVTFEKPWRMGLKILI